MVSLVNFKLVDDELHSSSLSEGERRRRLAGSPRELVGERSIVARDNKRAPTRAVAIVKLTLGKQQVSRQASKTTADNEQSVSCFAGSGIPQDCHSCVCIDKPVPPMSTHAINSAANSKLHDDSSQHSLAPQEEGAAGERATPPMAGAVAQPGATNGTGASFTVTWRALKFSLEPKWHEKIAQSSSFMALTSRVAPSASAAGKPAVEVVDSESVTAAAEDDSPSQHQRQQQEQQEQDEQQENRQRQQVVGNAAPSAAACVTRVVLDRLDGSFRSGELTAILGPSGAGKTTLLDCLTGHRKKGLSGSIKISPSSDQQRAHIGTACTANDRYRHELHNNTNSNKKDLILSSAGACCPCHPADQRPLRPFGLPQAAPQPPINGDNLKVSIIPQNDHLIGHLTVYETLSYASKMKNCLKRHFDHKLNVRRVAQQLGLMSCLGTRINKLSGGQYKRVSIAQELLSSPDILILDEPTSGLDAMTCYQTVQVLRKLTNDRQRQSLESPDQKPIAVILTIHQPNSDVFQQFNHVYVVAQGGKCIYEGPPGVIESVINRVGLELPNSYYNPATMIVEIAAGKFGQGAIYKLNSIQKKQYIERCPNLDEQNSTGDSAVDCPSSSSNDDYSGGDDDDEGDPCCCCATTVEGPNCTKGSLENRMVRPIKRFKTRQTEIGNNGGNKLENEKEKSTRGLVNKGFIMESDDNNNSGADQNTSSGVVIVIPEQTDDGKTLAATVGAIKTPFDSNLAGHKNNNNNERERRNRKRRRTKRRSANDNLNTSIQVIAKKQNVDNQKLSIKKNSSSLSQLVCAGLGGGAGDGDGSGSDGGGGGGSNKKRLKLNSLKADQKFPFWRHTYLHFHRSWLSIVRDPMLCSMQLALHIIVPVMVSLVYGTYVGKPNACPRAGPIDIMAYALEPTDKALQLQEDLRTTLENIGYIFFKLYGIIFAAMTVTVLTFPLDMHVLVKEFRNGWYGLASYFLGRTLADIPFQLTLPLLAMSLSYYATGQPSSYLQWRFFSITAVLILSSLIAQSQGLLFGAILMDKMKAAVFVAPAATTPIILFAGFLVRTQSIPSYLRPLSNLSYLRYAIEACLISRYGFNQCECDPVIFNQTVPELPPIARSMLDYWLSSFKPQPAYDSSASLLDGATNATMNALETTTTTAATLAQPDLFGKLIDSLARANSFGRNITSCEQVVPYPMIDYDLKDSQLYSCFAILLAMLMFTRLLTFFIVCYKVKRKV